MSSMPEEESAAPDVCYMMGDVPNETPRLQMHLLTDETTIQQMNREDETYAQAQERRRIMHTSIAETRQ